MQFLEGLPPILRVATEGVRLVVAHARPGNDMRGIYPDTPEHELRRVLELAAADVVILGHTHVAMAWSVNGCLVANPGALLRDPAEPMGGDEDPGDTDPRGAVRPARDGGTFGMLVLPARRFSVHRAKDGEAVELATWRS